MSLPAEPTFSFARWTRYLAVLGVILAFSLVWIVPGTTYDFVYDWLSARAFIDGLNPHQTLDALTDVYGLTNELQYIHPRIPGALVILAPIGVVPFSMEYVVGRLLTVGSAFGLALIFARLANIRATIVVALVPITLLIPPFSMVLRVSQTDFLIAALIGATLLLVNKGDRALAGIPLGIAVTLKLWAWPLCFALILGRRWRAGVGAMVTFTVLNMVGLAFPHVSVAGTSDALSSVWSLHQSRTGSLTAILGVSPLLLPILLVMLMAAWALSKREPKWDLLFVFAIPVALMVAPIVWITYTVSFLIPIAWLLSRRSDHRSPSIRRSEPSLG